MTAPKSQARLVGATPAAARPGADEAPCEFGRSSSRAAPNRGPMRVNGGLLIFGLAALLTVLAVLVLNLVVDPYQTGLAPPEWRLELDRPLSSRKSRHAKALALQQLRPTVVVLGTSRSEIGIDPTHPALSGRGQAYNLSLPATDMRETLRAYRAALHAQPGLHTVVLGLDLIAFAPAPHLRDLEPELDPWWFPQDPWRPALEMLASHHTAIASLTTLARHITDLPANEQQRADGLLLRVNPEGVSAEVAFARTLKRYYFGERAWYTLYRTDPLQLAALAELVADARSRRVTLKVFVSPAHALQWQALWASGLWPAFEQWKRDVAAIVPYIDFSGFNALTTEPLRPRMRHYLESSHYLPTVGGAVLDRLFGLEPGEATSKEAGAGFGASVTAATVEQHLQQTRLDHVRWADSNPQEARRVCDWLGQARRLDAEDTARISRCRPAEH